MSPRTGRPKSENPMNDRIYVRVTKQEKKEITDFSSENGYSILELIRIGIEKIRSQKNKVLQKLAEYEDLEEQGRLIKLPCKDVYFIVDINSPKYAMVMKRHITELAIYEIEDIDKENCKYFSTEEKAEAKLKELR